MWVSQSRALHLNHSCCRASPGLVLTWVETKPTRINLHPTPRQAHRSVALILAALGAPGSALTSSFQGLRLGPSPLSGSGGCGRSKQQKPSLWTGFPWKVCAALGPQEVTSPAQSREPELEPTLQLPSSSVSSLARERARLCPP